MILLAELGRAIVVKTTAPAVTSKLIASEVCTLIEVISLIVEVTTSAMVSTCIEVTSVAEASTTSARYVSWYTPADS